MAKSRSRMYGKPFASPKVAGTAKSPGYGGKANDEGGRFVDRNLLGVSPNKEQFEPTDAEPVPQRYKMGGGC